MCGACECVVVVVVVGGGGGGGGGGGELVCAGVCVESVCGLVWVGGWVQVCKWVCVPLWVCEFSERTRCPAPSFDVTAKRKGKWHPHPA